MPQYELVREIGESLAKIVRTEAERQKLALDALLVAPDAEFYKSRKPAVAIYLHQLAVEHSQEEEGEEREEEIEVDGEKFAVMYRRPLLLMLRFCVAARGANPVEEQLALVVAMKAFHEEPYLVEKVRVGTNWDDQEIAVDSDMEWDTGLHAHLLQTLGVPHHPMIGYKVKARIRGERELRRRRKVERRHMEIFDKDFPPEGRGEDADRTKTPKPGTAAGPRAAKGR